MYLKLPNGRPSRSYLSELFGYPPPEAFVKFVHTLYERSGIDGETAGELFAYLTGWYLAGGRASRYKSTPPELLPFATMGVDGVHLGYVVHAPELELEDYPVGENSPMDDSGIYLVGNNTNEALENLMSDRLGDLAQGVRKIGEKAPTDEETQLIQHLSNRLGLHPDISKAGRRYGPDRNGLPVVPYVPDGWLHLPSSDGVGVLASKAAFGPLPLLEFNAKEAADNYIQAADRAFAASFPATALYYSREGYWHSWADDVTEAFRIRMMHAYNMLGRQLLIRWLFR